MYVLYHCPLNYKVQLPYKKDMQLIVSLIDHWDRVCSYPKRRRG